MKKNRFISFVLPVLTTISLIISLIMGIIYYGSIEDSGYIKFLLNINNTFKTFLFSPVVTMSDARKFADLYASNHSYTYLAYAYMAIIILAPMCTTTIIFNRLEKEIKLLFSKLKGYGKDTVIIFGFNENIKFLVKDLREHHKGQNVICVMKERISETDELFLARNGAIYHYMEFGEKIHEGMVRESKITGRVITRINLNRVRNMIIMEQSEVRSFASLIEINELIRKSKIIHPIKCMIYCESEGIRKLIENFCAHDPKVDDSAEKCRNVDIQIIDQHRIRVREIFRTKPVYTVNQMKISEFDPKTDLVSFPSTHFDVNVLVIGLGKFGKETIKYLVNSCPLHSSGRMTIHVFDQNALRKKSEVEAIFDRQSILTSQDTINISDANEESGSSIRFYNCDIYSNDFKDKIRGIRDLTYIIIGTRNSDMSITILNTLISALGQTHPNLNKIPIAVRMDTDDTVSDYFRESKGLYESVFPIIPMSDIFTAENFVDSQADDAAKAFHQMYNKLNKDSREEWTSLTIQRKESNRLASEHVSIKRWLLEDVYKLSITRPFVMDLLECSPEELMVSLNLEENRVILELAKLEHRRWNHTMYTSAYRYREPQIENGKKKYKDETKLWHSCLTDWDSLVRTRVDTIPYDLISVLASINIK